MADVILQRAQPGQPRAVIQVANTNNHNPGKFIIPKATPTQETGIPTTTLQPETQQPPKQQPTSPDIVNPEAQLDDFANPNKFAPASVYSGSEYSEDPNNNITDDNSEYDPAFNPPPPAVNPEPEPTPPFRSLDEERAHIQFQLHKLKDSNIPVRAFSYKADILEMRAELARVKAELDTTAAVKFGKKALMFVVSGVEFMSRKQNVLDIHLDGWSESVHQNLDDFDSVLEALYIKHKGKVSVSPEVQLLLMLVGSAVTWHITHNMIKFAMPAMGQMHVPHMPQMPQMPVTQPSGNEPQGRRMKGPGFDVTSFLKPPVPPPFPAPARERFDPVENNTTTEPPNAKSNHGSEADFSEVDAMSVLSEVSLPNDIGDLAKDNLVREVTIVPRQVPAKRRKTGPPAKNKNVVVL